MIGRSCAIASGVRFLMAAWWHWPVELVTERACAIMAGAPAELERVAADSGLLESGDRA